MMDDGSYRRSDFSKGFVATCRHHRAWCVAEGSDGLRKGSVPFYSSTCHKWAARRIQKSSTEDLVLKIYGYSKIVLKIF